MFVRLTLPMWLTLLAVTLCAFGALADRPVLGGDAAHANASADPAPTGPAGLAWARHFKAERLGSALEPVLAGGRVFVTTHEGSLYALDAESGNPVWRAGFPGAILQAPAVSAGADVIAADITGRVAIVDADGGTLRHELTLDPAGFAAAPVVADGVAILSSRGGEVYAIDLAAGRVKWQTPLGVPVRQTAAVKDRAVYVTGEDLRVRRLDLSGGSVAWTSEPLSGQTARDYYPVVASAGGREFVIVRTNPSTQFSKQILRDRELLCRSAGIDGGDWKTVEAWSSSPEAAGTAERFEKEQASIERYLREDPSGKTFFVLDAKTGKEAQVAPVLWAAGCQGVGTPPAVAPDGRLLVYYRSAYGNWNHGVAPLVALGLYDLATNRIEPLRHAHGSKPPWNTFWGTADESQHFQWAGKTLLIVHQSTLTAFDPRTGRLTTLFGDRDSWGGFRNLPWARNEWNGPGRGGVALDAKGRVFWMTGSRLLCLSSTSASKGRPTDTEIDGTTVTSHARLSPAERPAALDASKERLAKAVEEVLSKTWAPLYVEPGLAGHEFFFDQSGDTCQALSMACPHLPAALQQRVRARLAKEWEAHPPFDHRTWYDRGNGDRREWFRGVPREVTSESVDPAKPPFQPFGNLYAVWLFAERCGEWDRVLAARDGLRRSFEDFANSNWRLDPAKGDVNANRYLAALVAYERIARRAGDAAGAKRAADLAAQTKAALVEWWKRAASEASTPVIKDIGEFDRFLGRGDAIFLVKPAHRAKLGLLHGLTPEVATLVRDGAGDAPLRLWATFTALCPTWQLVGEERQVHYGENLYDPPDFAFDAFCTLAWIKGGEAAELRARVDQPWCHADLFHVMKLAVAIEQSK